MRRQNWGDKIGIALSLLNLIKFSHDKFQKNQLYLNSKFNGVQIKNVILISVATLKKAYLSISNFRISTFLGGVLFDCLTY